MLILKYFATVGTVLTAALLALSAYLASSEPTARVGTLPMFWMDPGNWLGCAGEAMPSLFFPTFKERFE